MTTEKLPIEVEQSVAYWQIRNAVCNQSIIQDVESIARYLYRHNRRRIVMKKYSGLKTVYFMLTDDTFLAEAILYMKRISPKLILHVNQENRS